jgi:hypothetical protein
MTDEWIKDTGFVLALLVLVAGLRYGRAFFIASALLLLVSLLIPKVLYPVAYLWLKLSELLNLIIPKVFFGLVFFVIIVPLGLFRRLTKGDTLLIKDWREARTSFVERNHRFSRQDMEVLY